MMPLPTNSHLYDNAGTSLLGGFAPGSAKCVFPTSQGTLNCADTTVSMSGNDLVIAWNITRPTVPSPAANRFMDTHAMIPISLTVFGDGHVEHFRRGQRRTSKGGKRKPHRFRAARADATFKHKRGRQISGALLFAILAVRIA